MDELTWKSNLDRFHQSGEMNAAPVYAPIERLSGMDIWPEEDLIWLFFHAEVLLRQCRTSTRL